MRHRRNFDHDSKPPSNFPRGSPGPVAPTDEQIFEMTVRQWTAFVWGATWEAPTIDHPSRDARIREEQQVAQTLLNTLMVEASRNLDPSVPPWVRLIHRVIEIGANRLAAYRAQKAHPGVPQDKDRLSDIQASSSVGKQAVVQAESGPIPRTPWAIDETEGCVVDADGRRIPGFADGLCPECETLDPRVRDWIVQIINSHEILVTACRTVLNACITSGAVDVSLVLNQVSSALGSPYLRTPPRRTSQGVIVRPEEELTGEPDADSDHTV